MDGKALRPTDIVFNPIQTVVVVGVVVVVGGGGGLKVPALVSSFMNHIWQVLLKFIGEQDYGKILRQGYHSLSCQPHFSSIALKQKCY